MVPRDSIFRVLGFFFFFFFFILRLDDSCLESVLYNRIEIDPLDRHIRAVVEWLWVVPVYPPVGGCQILTWKMGARGMVV